MPDSVCDVKLLKKSFQENREIIRKADRKIEKCAEEIRKGRYPKTACIFIAESPDYSASVCGTTAKPKVTRIN